MKIVHAADLHGGILTHSRPDPATGIPSRILDVAGAWRSIAELAIAEEADAVILAGDVFHTQNPGATELALFAEPLRDLSRHGIPTLIIPGNHDRAPHGGRPSVLEAFDARARGASILESSAPVIVATTPAVYDVGAVRVAALPSVSRAELAALAGWDRLRTEEEAVELLRATIAHLAATEADVLTLHTSIAGGVLGSEKDLAIIPEPMLAPADLEGPWRYVAAGHIHKPQILTASSDPTIAYAGSVAPLTFGEEGEHGCYLVQIDGRSRKLGRTLSTSFVPIESRRLLSLSFHRRLELDLELVGTKRQEDLEGAIVRVRDVPADQAGRVRERMLAAGAWIVQIQTEREERAVGTELERLEDLPAPREALQEWLRDRRPELEENERARLVELAGALEER